MFIFEQFLNLYGKISHLIWWSYVKVCKCLGFSDFVIDVISKIVMVLLVVWFLIFLVMILILIFWKIFKLIFTKDKEFKIFKHQFPDITKKEFKRIKKAYMLECADEEKKRNQKFKKRLAEIEANYISEKIKEEAKQREARLKKIKEMFESGQLSNN